MKLKKSVLLVLMVTLVAALGLAQDRKALTNKDIMDMVKQGLSDSVIIKVIQASDTNFDTSPDAMTQMQSSGASVGVMGAMLKAESSKKKAAPTAQPVAVTTPPPSPTMTNPHAGEFLLKEGTEVPLTFATDESSRYAAEGDKVALTLVSDIKIGDVVVVKEGAKAVAVVTHTKKAGMLPGSNGELNIQLKEMLSGGDRIRLRGTPARDGVLGPLGHIKHGNIEIEEGTPLTAYVDEDVWLLPAK
ncbi:MAG: hypothetical protein WBE13_01035 [Candidatus Acidiferrum sp.]